MEAAPREFSERDTSGLAAEERQRLLSRMLSRLAHEIRNPLSSLDVHVQLLEEDLVGVTPRIPAEITGRLEVIRHELHRLDAIVRQYLSLAAPTPIELQPVAVVPALHHLTRLLGPVAAERDITLEVSAPPGVPEILADAGQLQQALLNLRRSSNRSTPPRWKAAGSASGLPSKSPTPMAAPLA
ncbi:MAG: hypothetical protein HZC55_10160 [Verrucomicrobia bacterium]|nr:hypothetical protein [Verrucomicrobiota bacterium]